MAAHKAKGAEKKENDANVENVKRSARFTQLETNLLCSLVIDSDLNTNVTNKLTKYGRLAGWDDIARVFNASPDVSVGFISILFISNVPIFISVFNSSFFSQYRTAKVLKERAHNIRKDLNKLSSFTLACSLATGGGHMPPTKPPKVSFELSDEVKAYAEQLQMKLVGLQPTCSDAPLLKAVTATIQPEQSTQSPIPNLTKKQLLRPSQQTESASTKKRLPTPLQQTESASTQTQLPTPSQQTESASAQPIPTELTLQSSRSEVAATTSTRSLPSTPPPAEATAAGKLFPSSTQFFATQKQRTRKRNNVASSGSSTISSHYSSCSVRNNYYERKLAFINDENARRAEWHSICVQMKKKELELWDLAISKLRSNTVYQH